MENLNGERPHVATSPTIDVTDALAVARLKLAGIDEKVRDFVSEKPVVALGMAVVAGFLISRLLTR